MADDLIDDLMINMMTKLTGHVEPWSTVELEDTAKYLRAVLIPLGLFADGGFAAFALRLEGRFNTRMEERGIDTALFGIVSPRNFA